MRNRLSRLQTREDRLPRLGRTMLKAFGLLLAFAGAFSIANELKTNQQSIRIMGKIYSVRETDQSGSRKYFPSIEFSTHDGQVIHFQGPASSTKPETNTEIPVIYNISKPELAQVDSGAQRWLLASVSIPLGFAMLVAAAFWRPA